MLWIASSLISCMYRDADKNYSTQESIDTVRASNDQEGGNSASVERDSGSGSECSSEGTVDRVSYLYSAC